MERERRVNTYLNKEKITPDKKSERRGSLNAIYSNASSSDGSNIMSLGGDEPKLQTKRRPKKINGNNNLECVATDTMTWYRSHACSRPVLTKDEEAALSRRIKNGEEQAQRDLAEHSLRFVISIARRFWGRAEPLDLIQAGNIGLVEASEKYDSDTGAKFWTFATPRVRGSMLEEIYRQSSRLHISEKEHKRNGRVRSLDDACFRQGEDRHSSQKAAKILEREPKDIDQARQTIYELDNVLSLQEPKDFSNKDGSPIQDFIEDSKSISPSRAVDDEMQFSQLLSSLVSVVSNRDSKLYLMNRFFVYSLDDLAEKYGLTKSTVAVLISSVKSKLKGLNKAHY